MAIFPMKDSSLVALNEKEISDVSGGIAWSTAARIALLDSGSFSPLIGAFTLGFYIGTYGYNLYRSNYGYY